MKALILGGVLAFLVIETAGAESSCPPDCGFKIQFCNETPADLGIRITTTGGRFELDDHTNADVVDKLAKVMPGQCGAALESPDPGSKCVSKATDGLLVAHVGSKAKGLALPWQFPGIDPGKCYAGLATVHLKIKPGVSAEQLQLETYATNVFDLTVDAPSATPAKKE